MKLKVQKRLAGEVLNCSPNRTWFDPERSSEIKEAITKIDIRNLVKDGMIAKKPANATSRVRARKMHLQKISGRKRGQGSRKGTKNARQSTKETWINNVRAQRKLLSALKEKKLVTREVYHELYSKSKGGFFRSRKHLKLYIEERNLAKER